MTALNKQALREAAQEEIMLRSVSDTSDAWQDEASPETALSLLDELEAAEKRIAELEARKFKVEMPESFYPDGDIEAPLVLQEHEVIAAIVAAGGMPIAICRRCKSELDLSHRPDGSHYCHAPAAGSGVKGE